jgi:hypothetical protein
MRGHFTFSISAMFLLGAAVSAWPAEILKLDFQQSGSPAKLDALDVGKVDAAFVPGGADGRGHCLRIHNSAPATECRLALKGPIKMQKNLTLSLDHREEAEPGFEGAYLGIAFYVQGKQWFWTSDTFSPTWHHLDIPLAQLKSSSGQTLRLDTVFSKIGIYGRVKEKSAVRDATKARLTVWIDNLRLHTDAVPCPSAGSPRVSYSNPAMFIWTPSAAGGRQKFQYSQDPAFAADAARSVETPWNFFTPAGTMRPGTWYARVWRESELGSGWSAVATTVIPPEAHRFTTSPIPAEELRHAPRPRLLAVAKIGQPDVTPQRKSQLVKLAKKLYDRGVPEHPGPHVAGDPRWPTWIDWYGKVAGGITGGTGRRLQQIGQYAMLSGDRQVIAWAKQMALDACRWDPEGGSAMERGDIGAHHLLRGLTWCYDACYDAMTPAERETLQKIIIQRTGQFWKRLNPFRGSEANNHAWLQSLALGEAGIVLLGDDPQADAWAEYARQLYLGRFLCCLGYQGDNNEGIGYWNYGLGFIVEYGDLLKAVCGIDLFGHPWLSQTARFPMYCAPPNAWAVSFADTGMPNHGVRGPAETSTVRDLALRCRDPYALWYSGQREPLEGLTPRPPRDLPPSIHYRHIGVVIFNTSLVDGREGATVAMHSGPYWAGHQHADQNHFVIHAYGEKLAIDGGYYDWYGSPHFNAYSMQTVAHNTLLVDGRGQADRQPGADGRVAAYFDSPGYGYTVGDAAKPEVYRGLLKRFDRRLLFIKPSVKRPGFVVIHDLLTSTAASARYDWLLHAIVPIQTEAATRSFQVVCPNAALHGRFFLPARLTIDVKTGFPAEPVNRYSTLPVPKENYFPEWVIHAVPQEPAAAEEFFVAIEIQRRGDRPRPPARMTAVEAPGARAVRLECGDRTQLAMFRAPDAKGSIQAGGLAGDGQVAAVELDAGGKILGAMTVGATSLSYRDKSLFQSDKPADWSMPAAP